MTEIQIPVGGGALISVSGVVGDLVAQALSESETLEGARDVLLRRRSLYVYRGRVWLLFDSAAVVVDTAIQNRELERLEAERSALTSGTVAASAPCRRARSGRER